MLPFCRTPDECKKVLDIMEEHGLKRKENGLKIALCDKIKQEVCMMYVMSVTVPLSVSVVMTDSNS